MSAVERKPKRRGMLSRWWAPADILLVLAVIGLSAFLIMQSVASAGDDFDLEISISVNGREVLVFPLQEGRRELVIDGYQGKSYVEIADGQVHMIDSACPDKLCVHMGWKSHSGESIICLPNRVVIEVRSGEGGPDVINQ